MSNLKLLGELFLRHAVFTKNVVSKVKLIEMYLIEMEQPDAAVEI
jgi:hypothetical protein